MRSGVGRDLANRADPSHFWHVASVEVFWSWSFSEEDETIPESIAKANAKRIRSSPGPMAIVIDHPYERFLDGCPFFYFDEFIQFLS